MKVCNCIQALLVAGVVFTAKVALAVSIETILIGNPNNPADTTVMQDGTSGYGSVDHTYAIGKYEVTIGQYTEFLNAVAAADPYSLYNPNMGSNMTVAGITQSGSSGNCSYSVMLNSGNSSNRPITYVSWFDAARFSNWLANGQPTGPQGNATTEDGAYSLNGAMSGLGFTKNNINPNTGQAVTWWIPSENEWYKAAYYNSSNSSYSLFATQSGIAPPNVVGSGGGVNYNTQDAGGAGYAVTQSVSFDPSQNYLTAVGAYPSPSFYGTCFAPDGNGKSAEKR